MKAEAHDAGLAPRRFSPLLAAALPLASLVVFLLNTRHGIGILPDSVAYMRLGVARHFAPLYTWLLFAASSFGADIVSAAKWFGFVFVALNTFLTWRLLSLATNSARYAAIGTILVISNPVFVQMHAVAMTEPLFLSLSLSAVLLFVHGVDDRQRMWFLLAGAAVGLALLTRFAAAPLLAALCVFRLAYPDRSFGRRLRDCVAIGFAAVLIFGAWMAASELTSGESTGRTFAFRGDPDAGFWWRSLESASIMLLPAPVPSAIRIPFLALAAAASIWAAIAWGRGWRRALQEGAAASWESTAGVLGLFALFYAAFLLLSVFIQPYLPLNGRMLLPLFVAVVLATTVAAGGIAGRGMRPSGLRIVLACVAAVILAANLARTVTGTAAAFSNGVGYADRAWSRSPVLAAVEQLPTGALVYSNAPDVITFRLHREAEYVPSKINHLTGVEDRARPFAKQLDETRRRLAQGDAYVAFLDGVDWRYYLASEQQLVAELSLVKVSDMADGRIYRGRQGD